MTDYMPISEEKVALFDLDHTVLDAKYGISDLRIYGTIQAVQGEGWTLGLSSDSPYEAMQLWRKRLGMNGPLVAEKGSVVDCYGQALYDEADGALYGSSRYALADYFRSCGVVIWEGNPVEAIRSNLKIGQSGDRVLLLNSLRRCSLGMFFRKVDEKGELVVDDTLTTQMAEETRNFYPPIDCLAEDLNYDQGLLIVAREAVTKRIGTKQLQEILGIGKLAMVGNSLADYVGQDLALHYAVGNASADFKAVADYVARASFSSGVVEILRGFMVPSSSVE